MGIVYLAEQSAPVHRRVALKVVKRGLDSRAVLARFDAERQALAVMDHPNIAKVLDAGINPSGQPWFAMEYVSGLPITDYCDRRQLPLRARIELFQQVCAGVQHAHQKGVIHRDLKPSNVLVVEVDGAASPRIIDFGLAKATQHGLFAGESLTEQGQMVGTPEYMSPEQAGLGTADIDTRSDVYSLGVMLYELLVGALPFAVADLRDKGPLGMQKMICEQEPAKPSTRLSTMASGFAAAAAARGLASRELQRALQGDLDWVTMRALEKDRTRRYQSPQELAADLQRYLQFEPVLASPPSTAYRLRKFVRKHRLLAGAVATIALVTALGAASTWQQSLAARANAERAEQNAVAALRKEAEARRNQQIAEERATENGKLAADNAALAESESKAKQQFATKVREFDQLAGVVLHEKALQAEHQLYPPWPAKIAELEAWLRDDAGRVLAMRPALRDTLSELRSRSVPATPEQLAAERRAHPRFAEFEQRTKWVAELRYAQALRRGEQVLVVPELTPQQIALDLNGLNKGSWQRVAPMAAERTIFGEAPLGLALARRAVNQAAATVFQHIVLDTLAWALFANGQDAEALQRSADALAKAPAKDKDRFAGKLADMQTACARSAVNLAEGERKLAEVSAVVDARWDYHFTDPAQRFLHETLTRLEQNLGTFAANQVPAVEQRLRWARAIGPLTKAHPVARATWEQARAAIAKADDVVASKLYAGKSIDLREDDVVGLVPIGMNPVTKLWEFYDLRSAWDGTVDPSTLPIPQHAADGSIAVTGDTGIVFVLLPGGEAKLGSSARKDSPYYDPMRFDNETLHKVDLAPFFLGRHEVTKGQWLRLTNGDEPSHYTIGKTYPGNPEPIGYAHAVEQVSWQMCQSLFGQHGICLPTEAQWEHACRAGTTTRYWAGANSKDLAGCANITDQTSERYQPKWDKPSGDFDDGRVSLAPVGSYRANPFGLFDMHGNVAEWCQCSYGDYGTERPGDGFRPPGIPAPTLWIYRGGSFSNSVNEAGAASRSGSAVDYRFGNLGVRAARLLRS